MEQAAESRGGDIDEMADAGARGPHHIQRANSALAETGCGLVDIRWNGHRSAEVVCSPEWKGPEDDAIEMRRDPIDDAIQSPVAASGDNHLTAIHDGLGRECLGAALGGGLAHVAVIDASQMLLQPSRVDVAACTGIKNDASAHGRAD